MPQISFSEINELVGSLGIGSIAILAAFLTLDSMTPVFRLVEDTAESRSWALFMVLPLAVFSYVAGVICVAIGGMLRQRFLVATRLQCDWKSIDDNILNIVTLEYRNYRRKIDVLDGSVSAFLLLAVGVMLDAIAISQPTLGIIICLACLFASLSCALIGVRTERELNSFILGATGPTGTD